MGNSRHDAKRALQIIFSDLKQSRASALVCQQMNLRIHLLRGKPTNPANGSAPFSLAVA